MNNENSPADLATKQELLEQLHRWTRSADRNDRELMLSVFHPDANINYGFFNGGTAQFCDWVIDFHSNQLTSTAHYILNPLFKLSGNTANSEACVRAYLRMKNGDSYQELVLSGRYLDRWERRGTQWRIIDRVAMVDRYEMRPVSLAGTPPLMEKVIYGTRDSTDPSYQYI